MKNKEWYSNQNQNIKHDYIPKQWEYELWSFINSLIFFMCSENAQIWTIIISDCIKQL